MKKNKWYKSSNLPKEARETYEKLNLEAAKILKEKNRGETDEAMAL